MHKYRYASLVVALLFAAATSQAVTYIVPPDRELVKQAEAIVVATGVSSRAHQTADGRFVTTATLRVERVLSGKVKRGQLLELTELGGVVGDRGLFVAGSPRYDAGARYLILVTTNRHDETATLSMGLGRFAFVKDTEGHEVLSRAVGDEPIVGIVEGKSEMHVERLRDADRFIAFIGETLAGKTSSIDYDVDPTKHRVIVSASTHLFPQANATRASYLMAGNPRWPAPTAQFLTNGTQPGFADGGRTSSSGGMAMWNAGSGNTNYSLGGTTSSTDGLSNFDSVNSILFNDPTGLVQDQRNSSGNQNIAAIGGTWTSGSHPLDGETFSTVVNGDVEVGKNLNFPEATFQAIMAHELGHTLGFRHSNEGTPNTTQAIMNSIVSVTTLQQYDLDAEATVYGAGAVCTNPSITSHPQSVTINSGSGTTLSVSATGTSPTYQWYQGASGVTSTPLGTASTQFVSPTSTTQYWVRVSACSTSVNSNAATVTVATCSNPSSVTISANNTNITAGQAVILNAQTTGGSGVTIEWLENGIVVGSGTQIQRFPSQNSQYQARATGTGCGSGVLSNAIIVNVSPAPCGNNPSSVSITSNTTSITSGQSVTLNASTTGGAGVTIQWLENGIVVGSGTQIQRFPTFNSQYQARATGSGCSSGILSNAITVNVAPPGSCAVSINSATASPNPVLPGQAFTLSASATTPSGTITYSWFKGNLNDTSNPVGNGASVAILGGQNAVSQNYWVRATSSCGSQAVATQQVTVNLNTGTCNSSQLCINNARYRITLTATAPNGQTAQGVPLYQSNVFGYFSLPAFTGNAGNPEVFVKVVGPVNGVPWVFYAGLTNLDYTVTVTDTQTGQVFNTYRVAPPPAGSTQNIGNFDVGGSTSSQCSAVSITSGQTSAGGGCVNNNSTLCLLNRFRLSLTAKDNPTRSNNSGPGTAVPVNDVFGFFTTPTLSGDPNDIQAFVKMVDATSIGLNYWVFLGGLTDFEFTLTVTDTANGRQKIYNKPPGSTCGLNDVNAFTP